MPDSGGDLFKTGGGLDDFQAVIAAQWEDDFVGSHLGNYQVLGLIAAGGMGRVYLAERVDGSFERAVAIKVLPPGLGGEFTKRFDLERKILASLSHGNIAQLYDAGVSDAGNLYLVMEFVDGEPIDKYVSKHSSTYAEKTHLMLTLCEALRFAHSKLVIHRDVKPSNVFVTKSGKLKLLDFGIAKILKASEDVTVETRPMTPLYASPEQLLNESVSVASDIYQFGLLFLSLFELHEQSDEESRASATRRAINKISLSVESQLKTSIPPELAAVINKCLRAESSERYGSASELAADLRAYLGGYPVSARNPGRVRRAAKFFKRNWLLSSTIMGFTFLLVMSTVFYIHSIDEERKEVIEANRKAQVEAAVASSTSDFLLKMIGGANRLANPEGPRTVTEAILNGAEILKNELSEQPAVRARLTIQLGSVLNGTDEWRAALDLFDAVAADLLTHPEITFHQRMLLRTNVAYANYRLSHFDLARQQYEDIIRIYEEGGTANQEPYATAWRRLGLLERRAGNFEIGAEYMSRAEIAFIAAGASKKTLAGFSSDYGLVLSELGDWDAAMAKYLQSVEMFRDIQGDNCSSCAITMDNAVFVLRKQHKLEEALDMITEVDAIFRNLIGEDYGVRQAGVLLKFAAILNDMDRYEDSKPYHVRATDIYREKLGEEHSLYALSLHNHAVTHRDHDRCDLALPLFRSAREIQTRLFGEKSHWVQDANKKIQDCLDGE